MASTRSAAASSTCSQLSNTNSRTLPSNAAATSSRHCHSGLLGDAQHRGHRVGHRRRIGDRSQARKPRHRRGIHRPSRAATSSGQAGLADPADPGQRHQSVCLAAPFRISATSDSRPIEAGRRTPQVSRRRVQRPQRRKLGREVQAARTWNSPTGLGTSRNRRGPRSTRSTPLSRPAVDSASRIWPPCPAAITRAARFSTAPK